MCSIAGGVCTLFDRGGIEHDNLERLALPWD